ncbi:MAG TPA: adenylosuccinate synthase [Anaerolineales bacterium]
MPLDIVIGTQWGDEGKGRIVDLLAARADIVARYNGGDNAGHTVTVGSQTFKLHLIPSGAIHPHTIGVLGNGMVINPSMFLSEIEMLREAGVPVTPERLQVSYAAHLITPGHKAMDAAIEKSRGLGQIGTTGRGIGPAYTDKASRRGLRMQDMLDINQFRGKLANHIQWVNGTLEARYQSDPLDTIAIVDEYSGYAEQIIPYIQDVATYLRDALANGRRVMAEGAQGTLLDLDHGTYPFVTSSSTTSAGALVGLGLGIVPVERVFGVTKAYQTRVGAGPFPTEVSGELATRLRGTGSNPWDEFGTVTGRPRRVGWLDAVLLRYAVQLNGVSDVVMTKLDVLSGIPSLKLCVAYRLGGKEYRDLPFGPADLSPFEPVYEELPGWQAEVRQARSWEELPGEARHYILRIEELAGAPVRYVSVGPEREQIVETEP